MGINWTDDIIERLTEHFGDKLTALDSSIKLTAEFGIPFTRNMVIAKRNRMNMLQGHEEARHKMRMAALRRHKQARAQTGAPDPTRVRKPSAFTVTSNKTGLFVPGKELPRSPIPAEDEPPADLVKFADLTERSCRWIYGDPHDAAHGFCGKPVIPGLSWCDLHKSRVFQPPQPRRYVPAVVRIPTIADLEKV
jgi:hypothetical protein